MSTNQKQSKDKTTSLMQKKRGVSKNHTENAKTLGVIIRDE